MVECSFDIFLWMKNMVCFLVKPEAWGSFSDLTQIKELSN